MIGVVFISKYLESLVNYNRVKVECNSIPASILVDLRREADRRGIYSITNYDWGMTRYQESTKLPKFDIVVSGFDVYLESEICRFAIAGTAKRACETMWRYIHHADLHVEGGRIYCLIKATLRMPCGNADYDRLQNEVYGRFEKNYRAFIQEILPKFKGVSKNEIIWNCKKR